MILGIIMAKLRDEDLMVFYTIFALWVKSKK
jgi:hypothetical protein